MKTAVLNIIKNEKGETLFLLRKTRPFGWGLVGGKIEDGEEALDACLRETTEETGLNLDRSSVKFIGNNISVDETPILVYETALDHTPEIKIRDGEHLNARWIKTHRSDYYMDHTENVKSLHFAGRTLNIINTGKQTRPSI